MAKFYWVNMFVNLLFIVLTLTLTAQLNMRTWIVNAVILIAIQQFTLMSYRMALIEKQANKIEKSLEEIDGKKP